IGEIALIYEHQWPLSALCFMASDGIRKLDLQGIIVRVTFDGFQTIFFIRDILIICGNAFIKLLLLGIRHLGRINIQTIEYDPTLYGVTLMLSRNSKSRSAKRKPCISCTLLTLRTVAISPLAMKPVCF